MSHAFITGLVIGWISVMAAEVLALWLLERYLDRKREEDGK